MTRRILVVPLLLMLCWSSAVNCFPFIRGFHKSRQGELATVSVKDRAGSGVSSVVEADSKVVEEGPAGIAFAARQRLFGYSIGVALMFLRQNLQGQQVPDVSKSFSIPVVGSFDVQLSNIVLTNFTCSEKSANLTILGDGFFHLITRDIAANLTFQWHWTKAGLSGSGEGELLLGGGIIDWVYEVHKDEQLQAPQLQVITANSNFDTVDLKIHSYTADWVYQAVLSLFDGAVRRQVQSGVVAALDGDVPSRINDVLASLPTRLEVQGLPFTATFEYSLYTAAYVLISGFGEVEVPAALSDDGAARQQTALRHAATATTGEMMTAVAVQRRHRHRRNLADAESQQPQRTVTSGEPSAGLVLTQMVTCPFETTTLPLTPEAIGAESSQVSIYVHEATVNCLLWGLYRSGKLAFSLKDGFIPGLTITTDILALLIPELPTRYPHMKMIINVEALDTPHLAFSPDAGATLSAYYRLGLAVANESLGNPEVVRLAANLTVSGMFRWETTEIGSVVAHHEVEASQLEVPAEQWDATVQWLLQSYGSLLSLRQAVELLVRTPITSMVSLVHTKTSTWDRWYGMSADVQLRLPPPPKVASS